MTCSEIWRLVFGVLESEEKSGDERAKEPEGAAVSPEDGEPPERYLGALETASRTLLPLGILYDPAGTDLRAFPLTEESRFPLPPRFVSAAVYLTGYLLCGDIRLYNLYTAECESIRRDVPAEISRISS